MPKLLITGLFAFIFFVLATGNIYAANLLQNSGFESSLGDEWKTFGATATESADYKRSGSFSGKVESKPKSDGSYASGVKYIYQVVVVSPGKTYKASGYANKQGEKNAKVSLRFAFYGPSDGSGPQISSYSSGEFTSNTAEFQFLETSAIEAPENAGSVRVRPSVEMPSGATEAGVAYFDDLTFEEVSPQTPTPTPTSTPAPTKSPSPAPTKTPTPTPTATPTPEPTPIELAMDQEEVLGISGTGEETPTPTPTEEPKASSTSPKGILFASLLVIAGAGLVGLSAYSFFAQRSASDRIEDYEEKE